DPALADGSYRLPGNNSDCDANADKLCEYRIAHVFFSDWPAFGVATPPLIGAPPAFNFNVQIFINGEAKPLTYMGIVPELVCGVAPIPTRSPREQFDRPTDCGLADRSKIQSDAGASNSQVGIHFALTDGNLVEGRERIYSFRARPGDIAHFTAS